MVDNKEVVKLAENLRAERPLEPGDSCVEVTRTGASLWKKAATLAEAIDASSSSEKWLRPVAICGPWGSGKTSFLNQVVAALTKLNWIELDGAPLSPLAERGCILRFDPWVFGDRDSLIAAFFRLLIERYPDSDTALLLSRYAESLSFALSELSSKIKRSNGTSVAFRYGARLLDKSVVSKDYSSLENLTSLRSRIIKCLSESTSRPTLVVIDNIDRLCDEEIGYMFRFLGAVVDFPKTMHLLAYDDSVVTNALAGLQRVSGKGYHDKVVSLRIPLPQVDMAQVIRGLFREELNGLSEKDAALLTGRMSVLVETPRDANKLKAFLHVRRALGETSLFQTGPGELIDAYLRQFFPGTASKFEAFDAEEIERALVLFDDRQSVVLAGDSDEEKVRDGRQIIAKLLDWDISQFSDLLAECRSSESRVDKLRVVRLSSREKAWLVLRTVLALRLVGSQGDAESELITSRQKEVQRADDSRASNSDAIIHNGDGTKEKPALVFEKDKEEKLEYIEKTIGG